MDYSNNSSEVLVQNPNAYAVEVGATVTCRYSGRKILVAKRGEHGEVWEQIEANHPAVEGVAAE